MHDGGWPAAMHDGGWPEQHQPPPLDPSRPLPLCVTDRGQRTIQQCMQDIDYSYKYTDDTYEYRHVILPADIARMLPMPPRLLSDAQWRSLGVQQSRGWEHYLIHRYEPHVLMFRRPLGHDGAASPVAPQAEAAG
eukprot:TRINITY_DN14512_c0_g1_i1.p2 TRINITY_DN14512_c0_g1~~TRINITY_DN14512_c0_g1_i1.p2  ORF type:complete len:135 (+),score=7.72 TRINITY_DN14512_c0_g1_i1:81-485(+)